MGLWDQKTLQKWWKSKNLNSLPMQPKQWGKVENFELEIVTSFKFNWTCRLLKRRLKTDHLKTAAMKARKDISKEDTEHLLMPVSHSHDAVIEFKGHATKYFIYFIVYESIGTPLIQHPIPKARALIWSFVRSNWSQSCLMGVVIYHFYMGLALCMVTGKGLPQMVLFRMPLYAGVFKICLHRN